MYIICIVSLYHFYIISISLVISNTMVQLYHLYIIDISSLSNTMLQVYHLYIIFISSVYHLYIICNTTVQVYHPYIICISFVYHPYIIRISFVYHFYIICISFIYHMYIICISFVYHLYIIFISSVYHLYIICISSLSNTMLQVYHLYIICISFVYHLYIICISFVYHLYIIFISSIYHLHIICISSLSNTMLQLYHLYIICISFVYHLYIIFISSISNTTVQAYHFYIICISFVYHLYIIFISSIYHLHIICISSLSNTMLQLYHLYIICISFVYHLYIIFYLVTMHHTCHSAAKNLCGDTRDDDQNEPSSTAAATTLPHISNLLKTAINTLEPNPLVTQATFINHPPKKAQKEQLIRMNRGGGDRHRRGQLAPIDNEGKHSNNVSQRNLSSFHATLSSSPATHVPGHLNTDSDQDDISEVGAEDDWFGNPQDVQPGTSASSNVSKARNDERALWQEQDLNPGPTSSPLSAGEVTVVDDINRTQVGNSSAAKDTATVTQPIWPTKTDLVYVTGMNKVKLSLQSLLLQAIFKDTFENVRRDLLFEHAFPDAVAIPAVVRKALVSAAKANTFCDGRYNASAAAVHQRLLSHDDYQAKMIRLLRARIPIFRGEVKERCAHLVHVDFFPIKS
ncbi:hypothetical protein V8E52_006054 [Russula decolorans]